MVCTVSVMPVVSSLTGPAVSKVTPLFSRFSCLMKQLDAADSNIGLILSGALYTSFFWIEVTNHPLSGAFVFVGLLVNF